MSAYLRHQFPCLGINHPRLDALLQRLPAPEPEVKIDYALACWELPEREYQYAALRRLRSGAGRLSPDRLPDLEKLIVTKSWWDTVDELATNVVGPMVLAHPALVAEMDRWLESENIWLARTAILHQERWKARTDAERLFAYCLRRAGDREFFIRKAIGWSLRSYAATDPSAVARFVHDHESLLSGLSKREALREAQRQLLRGETGASRGSGRRSDLD
jgi:3-methyladenine DNA glycosylase AlkD